MNERPGTGHMRGHLPYDPRVGRNPSRWARIDRLRSWPRKRTPRRTHGHFSFVSGPWQPSRPSTQAAMPSKRQLLGDIEQLRAGPGPGLATSAHDRRGRNRRQCHAGHDGAAPDPTRIMPLASPPPSRPERGAMRPVQLSWQAMDCGLPTDHYLAEPVTPSAREGHGATSAGPKTRLATAHSICWQVPGGRGLRIPLRGCDGRQHCRCGGRAGGEARACRRVQGGRQTRSGRRGARRAVRRSLPGGLGAGGRRGVCAVPAVRACRGRRLGDRAV